MSEQSNPFRISPVEGPEGKGVNIPVKGEAVEWSDSSRPFVSNSALITPFSTGRPFTTWRSLTVILSVPLAIPIGR